MVLFLKWINRVCERLRMNSRLYALASLWLVRKPSLSAYITHSRMQRWIKSWHIKFPCHTDRVRREVNEVKPDSLTSITCCGKGISLFCVRENFQNAHWRLTDVSLSLSMAVPHLKPEASCIHFGHVKRGARGVARKFTKTKWQVGSTPLNQSDDRSECYLHTSTRGIRPTWTFHVPGPMLFTTFYQILPNNGIGDCESDKPRPRSEFSPITAPDFINTQEEKSGDMDPLSLSLISVMWTLFCFWLQLK